MTGNVLVLSRKPLRRRPVDRWLAGAASVSLVTAAGAVDGDDLSGYAEVATVGDYRSWQVEIEAARVAARHGVRLIASSSEQDVVRAARLRERLGLPGQSLASATAYRDKLVTKRIAEGAGIPVPAFAAVDTPGELVAFVEKHDLPVVLKPRRGGGPEHGHVIESTEDLHSVLASGVLPAAPAATGDWLVETFVAGTLCHVDGLAAAGRILHGWPSRYSGGDVEAARHGLPLASTMLGPDDPALAPLLDHAAAVVDALPHFPFPTSFHLQAWLPDGGGPPVLCEVASRTGGAFVADVYAAAFGVHLSRESLRGQAGLPVANVPATPDRYAGWVAVTPRSGTSTPPVPGLHVDVNGRAGQVHAGGSVATVVVHGDEPAQVTERMSTMLRWWSAMRTWR